jgi:hypothetical protein
MVEPQKFLSGFARFVQEHRQKSLYCYVGYSSTSGALLVRIKGSQTRVALRPWLRKEPVGTPDIVRSNNRYRIFRGQEPNVYVHIAREFRDNAARSVNASGTSCLITVPAQASALEIVGSKNLPQPLLDALLAYAAARGIATKYDFAGTVVRQKSNGEISETHIAQRVRNPKMFISYSWDSQAHRLWVLKLAGDLIRNGVDVLIDEWSLPDFSHDLHRFMETGIREAEYVLLVCTPTYTARANSRKGGVGVESTIITGEFYDAVKAKKFIAITRGATDGAQSVLPTYLKTRLAIDFTDDAAYKSRRAELLRRIFAQPRYRRPALGSIPEFDVEEL